VEETRTYVALDKTDSDVDHTFGLTV